MDEQSKVNAEEIVEKLKELVKKGNIARILLIRGATTIVNIPLNVGLLGTVIGVAAAPWGMLVAAIASLGLDCKIILVQKDGKQLEVFSRDVGKQVVDLGASVLEQFEKK